MAPSVPFMGQKGIDIGSERTKQRRCELRVVNLINFLKIFPSLFNFLNNTSSAAPAGQEKRFLIELFNVL